MVHHRTDKRIIAPVITQAIAFLLMLLWMFMLISKVYIYDEFVGVLGVSRWIPRQHAVIAAWILITCFAVCFTWLLVPRWRPAGFVISGLALLVFTVYITWIIATIPPIKRPCNCGGISRALSWPVQLTINVALTLLAGTASWISIHMLRNRKTRHPPAG